MVNPMTKRIHQAYGVRASSILYKYISGLSQKNALWILPANICPIVPLILFKAKKKIIFCDISKSSLCVDTSQALEILKRNSKVEGIIFVRTYGCSVDPSDFFQQAKEIKSRIFLVDDKCLCPPSFRTKITSADLTLYSTGYSKYVDLGWGAWGYAQSLPKQKDIKIRYLSQDYHEIEKNIRRSLQTGEKYDYADSHWLDTSDPQLSFKDYQQAVLNKMRFVKTQKKVLNKIYSDYLAEFALPDDYHNWRYNIKCRNPKEVVVEAFKAGYFASQHYKSLVPAFGAGHSQNSRFLASEVVNLFNDHRICPRGAQKLAKAIQKIIKRK
jgi:hypothetical protein